MVRQEEVTYTPAFGDLIGDWCVGVMRREDGAVVACFTHNNVDPEKVRRAAEEDRQGTPEAQRKDPHI